MREIVGNRREFLCVSSVTAWTVLSSGCGTVLYPERMGQRRGGMGDVDWTVAGLDAIGLVFFFVPGAIAFAVDFYNGTLFYATQSYGLDGEPGELKQVKLEEKNPSLETVEQAVATETGKTIELRKGNFVSRRLKSIGDFWKARGELREVS